MIDPAHDVILGGLALMRGGKPVSSLDGYALRVLGAEATFGNPQPVSTTLYSMLRDGSVVARERDENRQPVLLVEVQAALNDGNALAKGEAALLGVCRRPVELVWRPPQAGAEPVVFDVVDSNVEHAFDDINELLLRRTFRVTLSALPHGRRSVETVVPALTVPGAPTTVSVDTCDLLTGWSSPSGGATSQTGGYVQANVGPGGLGPIVFQRTGAVDFTPTVYLVVEWLGNNALEGSAWSPPTLDLGLKISEQVLVDGWTKTYYRLPADQTALTFRMQLSGNQPAAFLRIRDLTRTDSPPVLGTGRQSFRTLTVGGTVTTQGTIDVVAANGTTNLDDVLIFTFAGGRGYQPHVSPWRTLPASRTADTATITGEKHAVNVTSEWQIPAANIPDGEYLIVARMLDTAASTKAVTYTHRVRMGGVDRGFAFSETVNITLPSSNVWHFVTIGAINIPASPIGPTGVVKLGLVSGTEGSTLFLDELWLLSTDGRLTMLDGIDQPRLSIKAPSLTEEAGSVWIGTSADESDWWGGSFQLLARAQHDLEPGDNNLFVVCSSLANPAVTARHFDRFHSHPIAAE